jgi:putative ABC transport system permease protein
MRDDIRFGIRLLARDRGFTLAAVLTLAICIGANTALFSVIHGVLLSPLPVPDSDRIVLMGNCYPGAGYTIGENSSVPHYYDRLRETDVFTEQALFTTRSQSIDQNGSPARVEVGRVTPSFFRLVGVPAALGRTFTDAEGETGAEKKVVLSHAFWQSAFGGDAGAVGRDIRIDGEPYTVVGVMPRGFFFVDTDTRLWTPLAFTAQEKSDDARHSNNFRNIGRLKPGATVRQAQAEIDALNAANLERFPQYKELLINAGFHTQVSRLRDHLVRDVRPALYLMWGGALFVLLIGCVNVANLVLVRSRARLRELAIRLALGSGRYRVARQLVVESVLLALASAALGLAVGYGSLGLLGRLSLETLPRGNEVHLDAVVVLYTLAIAAGIGTILGLIPVVSVLPVSLTGALREEGRSGTSGRGARSLRRALIVTQVAFAYVLLIGAGLLFASFRQVLSVDPGFRSEGVVTASVRLPAARYKDDDALRAFADEALRRLRALPGVTAAGATDTIPFGDDHSDSVIMAEGHVMQPGESVISPSQVVATPGYFEAMGAVLASGRFIEERDTAAGGKVAIIDEKLARRFWPGQEAVGRRLYLPTDINSITTITKDTVFIEVVGVIRDMKLASLTEGERAVGAYFFPMTQSASPRLTFALRTGGDSAPVATALRGTLAQLDPELPVFDMRTMTERTERSLATRRTPVVLSLAFGAVSLFLSAIGIYGVLAYLVTLRTREIAIRLALGSSPTAVFELVLREGLLLIGGGLLLGTAGALAVRRGLESQLFGISATDPPVLIGVAALLALVAVVACLLPARRATRIDPALALAE